PLEELVQAAPQRGDLQLLSLLTATSFTRSFYAKNSSSLHLLIFQRSPYDKGSNRLQGILLEKAKVAATDKGYDR
ncbi:hypothetical protein, partial [Porphyromonas gingivalis]|uniref:hypothetical protein n=1 Tax=Porphyromonas gingivalis TaxID=837 RepID=UPI001C4DF78D